MITSRLRCHLISLRYQRLDSDGMTVTLAFNYTQALEMGNFLDVRRKPYDAEPLAILTKEIVNHATPDDWRGQTFIARTLLKSELARLYGWGKDTFRRRLRSVGLDFGRRKLLLPSEVAATVRALGPPSYKITF